MARRPLVAIAALMVGLQALGIGRTLVPAQDGLKFIRVARDFHRRSWGDVVRGSDQHPLYAACIALAEPPVAWALGESPTAWRIAAQLVSAVAAVATIVPLFGFARALFGERPALLATLIYALLPLPAAVGRDTLGDSLALLVFATSLRLGEIALRTGRRSAWIGTGLVSGVGYLVRPELLVVPLAVCVAAIPVGSAMRTVFGRVRRDGMVRIADPTRRLADFAGLGISALVIVGCYAMVKGEVSEKLALRLGAAMGSSSKAVRTTPVVWPKGLDDPRWDFSAKEETGKVDADLVRLRGSAGKTTLRLAQQWAEGFAWVGLPFFVWSVLKARSLEGSRVGRRLVAVYALLFSVLAIRHATNLGYLSGRHALTLVLATVPWVGAGIWAWVRGFAERWRLSDGWARRFAVAGLAGLIALGVTVQVKAMHTSRWGHWAAGQWLKEHAKPEQAVLDTRGWAMFVRGGRGYDYWHVRQALADENLAFVVVGEDELTAHSKRAATLRALLAYAAEPAAEFPDRAGKPGVAVRVYLFRRPDSWEEMLPMKLGLLERLVRGTRRTWLSDRHKAALPPDLAETVMAIESADRYHAKQGRSTARVRFDALSVYLKRHDRLPWPSRLAALVHPEGDHSPATTERRHLEHARALGIPVPADGAPGEEIGPWGRLRGFLMVAELVGSDEVNLVIPRLAASLEPSAFARFKRDVVAEMAEIAARLHRARSFHKDLYLCHYFLDPSKPVGHRLTLIDLHRLGRHRWTAWRWRWKDLGQLLYSTEGVAGINDRDRLRFWKHYRTRMGLKWPRAEARAIRSKAARYLAHNR